MRASKLITCMTCLWAGAIFASCSTPPQGRPETTVPQAPAAVATPAPPQAVVVAPPAPVTPPELNVPEIPKHPLKARTFSARGIEFSVVTFDTRDHEVVVDDQPGGPGSEYDEAEDAGQGYLAAINGGFFTPEGNPLGLVVTKGRRRGGLNRASFLGTGFFLGPQARLMSRTDYLKTNPKSSEILQSGPRLLWSGETLTGLSNNDERPRSFLLWDGRYHFALGYADSATLKGLSSALQSQPLSGFKIAYALNLDGGRSSDFWVSGSVSGGGFTRRSFFNKDVRNYLVLKKR